MNEDLIVDSFFDNVDGSLIKKNFILSKAVFKLSILYAILELLYWYITLSGSLRHILNTNAAFYYYRILPVIAFIVMGIGITGTLLYVKANKMIDLSIENASTDLFNSGYQLYYQSSKLSVLSFCISIMLVGARLYFK